MAPNSSTGRDSSPVAHGGRRVSRWLDRALTKAGLNRKAPLPPPRLPSPRPRPITPSDSLPCQPQKQSTFFSRLPLEIRREILLHAFGNRTIHMELVLDRPMPEEIKANSAGGSSHGGFTRERDVSLPRQWLWRSCVCHRYPPWLPHQQHNVWTRTWHRPDMDYCLEGRALCNAWPGQSPRKCRVGVLGWLLSCRQAYDEGIDLLYTSNTFNVSGEYLLTRLSDYILPARLIQMSKFEVFLRLSGYLHRESWIPESATVSLLLNELAQSGIKRLYMVIHCPESWSCTADVDLTKILDAVDKFVRKSGAESTVLQIDKYSLRGLAATTSTLEEEGAVRKQSGGVRRIWRGLDGSKGQESLDKRICLYPAVLAPLKDVASPELGRSQGYWILESHDYTIRTC